MGKMEDALENDDILCEILLRLPPRSVSKYKVVSRRWFRLINSYFFRHNYVNRWRGELHLLGFFVYDYGCICERPDKIRLPSRQLSNFLWPTRREAKVLERTDFFKGLGYFISTCNGLILSGFHPKKYYVSNPITKQLYQLPKPQLYCGYVSLAFWCEDADSLSINFKVVRVKTEYTFREEVNTVPIETFSSRTRRWSQSMLRCSSTFKLCPWTVATVIRGGAIHWLADNNKLAIHDLNQDDTNLTLIERPGGTYPDCFDVTYRSYGESSDGYLQYAESNSIGIDIWVLEKAQDGHIPSNNAYSHYKWNLRHKLSFSLMLMKNPAIASSYRRGSKKFKLLSLVPRNSESVFIRAGWKIFLYHLDSEKLELVPYRSGHCCYNSYWDWEFREIVPYYQQVFPYFPCGEGSNRM